VARIAAAGFFTRADGPVGVISAASQAERPPGDTTSDSGLIALVGGTSACSFASSVGSGTSSESGVTNSSRPAGSG
jgi:hypothetical protein